MEHERFEGERTLMRIHIGESDKWHGKPSTKLWWNISAKKD